MSNTSQTIKSNQIEPHDDLEKIITTFKTSEYQKPFAIHTVNLFHQLLEKGVFDHPSIILDLGCGNAKSSIYLAKLYKNSFVIGIDKSENRLAKNQTELPNLSVVRGDFIDLVRLLKNNGIKVELSCLFYPNPWPKKEHLKRRIHAHPFFGDLLEITSKIWHRTNWDILNLEFALSYRLWTKKLIGTNIVSEDSEIITDFERKYRNSLHTLWECKNF